MNIREFAKVFRLIYGNNRAVLEHQYSRYEKLARQFTKLFGDGELHFFSTPGRTELGGNHTDHNHGRVLAVGVNLDSVAVASKQEGSRVTLYSEGYEAPFMVDLSVLDIVEEERGTTKALIRGIASRFKQLGYQAGGFNACLSSEVLPGSGLSSSASIEVLIGTIFNNLFNNGTIPVETLAKIGQYAENQYFGKPCGLMDQITCAVGGIVSIDFMDPRKPLVEKVDFDFISHHYSLLVVDTGGNHANLTADYAAIPTEMKSVARALDATVCREIDVDDLFNNMRSLRKQVGDRALLRTLHFLGENERVMMQVAALKSGDFQRFLKLVNESGNSSFKWLQNIYAANNVRQQGLSLALALTEQYIGKVGEGACRVHGGGFAGTIQVFLPERVVTDYINQIEAVFGEGKVIVLSIRSAGTLCLFNRGI